MGISRKFVLFLATGAGAGYSPWFPGTMGTLVGLLVFWPLRYLAPEIYLVTLFALIFLSAWVANVAEVILGQKDSGKIVIDEIVGTLMTLAVLPITWDSFSPMTWKILVAGFFLFRLFDIWKPFPIRLIQDKVPGGWGVVGDDVAAGFVANLILQVITRIHF